MTGVVVCAVGLKGATFLRALVDRGVPVRRVFTYEQRDDRSESSKDIRTFAGALDIEVLERRRPDLRADDLTFVVGWQYLLPEPCPAATIVFHDSLLPRFRGFAPTVAALVKGETRLGVTALRPIAGPDEGPIFAQKAAPIAYPMRIADALALQAGLMVDLAATLFGQWQQDALHAVEQDHAAATYSLWRDERDYLIAWDAPAEEIARFVDATGYPYGGARTVFDSAPIRVFSATPLPDLRFEHRQWGKVWRLDEGRPVVVCGRGLLRLDACLHETGEPVTFTRLRSRFA